MSYLTKKGTTEDRTLFDSHMEIGFDKSISEIKSFIGEVSSEEQNQSKNLENISIEVNVNPGNLGQMENTGTTNTQKDFTNKTDQLKTLEIKLDELSQRNFGYVEENSSLRKNLEGFERLKYDNDKLRHVIEQLRDANEKFQVANMQLHEELKDRENDELKLTQQLGILKKELANTQGQLNQTSIQHEKQHLKKMLIKFMEGVSKGDAGAPDILKIICSLVDCTEKERNDLMGLIPKKEVKKSGSFNFFSK